MQFIAAPTSMQLCEDMCDSIVGFVDARVRTFFMVQTHPHLWMWRMLDVMSVYRYLGETDFALFCHMLFALASP